METRYPEEVKELSKKVTNALAGAYLKDSQEVIKCIIKGYPQAAGRQCSSNRAGIQGIVGSA